LYPESGIQNVDSRIAPKNSSSTFSGTSAVRILDFDEWNESHEHEKNFKVN
jgi:hypothetical protein